MGLPQPLRAHPDRRHRGTFTSGTFSSVTYLRPNGFHGFLLYTRFVKKLSAYRTQKPHDPRSALPKPWRGIFRAIAENFCPADHDRLTFVPELSQVLIISKRCLGLQFRCLSLSPNCRLHIALCFPTSSSSMLSTGNDAVLHILTQPGEVGDITSHPNGKLLIIVRIFLSRLQRL